MTRITNENADDRLIFLSKLLEQEKRRNRIIERVGWAIVGWVFGMMTAAVIVDMVA